jgi:arsenite methyltransferase
MHPLAVAARRHNSRAPQVRKVPGNLGLTLLQDLHKVADANLAPIHQVQQAQPRGIGERCKQRYQVERFGRPRHRFIIYALTDMYSGNTFALTYMKAGAVMPTESVQSNQTAVREKYGSIARSVAQSSASACCDPAMRCCDPITKNLYSADEHGQLPENAVLASLGCGNPTALIELKPGETVLDLGSGGGIDVLLSARRVGPTGKAYGLDMTDDMLALARENQRQAGATNVEFLKGQIENIPLPDNSVDVIISNCVINLSADKPRVLGEAFRVLRPGGRFAVSDVVVNGEVPDAVRQSMLLWVGCIAGALEQEDYRAKLLAAGFTDVDFEATRTYNIEDARVFLTEAGIDVDGIAPQVEGKFLSAFIRATKPAEGKSCCGPNCCS